MQLTATFHALLRRFRSVFTAPTFAVFVTVAASEQNVEAGDPEPFIISDHVNLLRQGQNILAIQGLNVSLTSSDFLITASLEAGQETPANPAATARSVICQPAARNSSTSSRTTAPSRGTSATARRGASTGLAGPIAPRRPRRRPRARARRRGLLPGRGLRPPRHWPGSPLVAPLVRDLRELRNRTLVFRDRRHAGELWLSGYR